MQVAEKTRLETEVLALWSRHPEIKLTFDTIVYCLGRRKWEVERALLSLEQANLVRRENKGEVTFYSLARRGGAGKK